jgi:site-specific recombinase XerD
MLHGRPKFVGMTNAENLPPRAPRRPSAAQSDIDRRTATDPDIGSAAHAASDSTRPTSPTPPRLLDRIRHAIRVRHYSIRTEEAYVDWARRFILFHDRRPPSELGAAEVSAFLTHLAVERKVAPSTKSQAKSALLFLYRVVLGVQLPWLDKIVAPKQSRRLPTVLTPSEVRALLHEMSGPTGLVTSLLYGTGMRLLEGLRLRVKDVEFEHGQLVVREGKCDLDRVTVLPQTLIPSL